MNIQQYNAFMKAPKRKHDYQLARELFVRHIADGQYQPGDRLPSRPRLAKMLDIGLISVQQAVKSLEREGVLYSIKGSGSYLKTIPSLKSMSEGNLPRHSPFDAEMLFGSCSGSASKLAIRFATFPGELDYFGDEWKKVIAEFEKKSHGISVETVPTSSMEELQDDLRKARIDVFQIHLGQLPLMLKSGLVLRPGGDLELDGGDFFTPVYEAACHDGVPWGIPLALSCNCMFYNRKWQNLVRSANEEGGFWSFLERLAKSPLPSGLEAFVANNHVVSELFRLASPVLRHCDADIDAFIDSPEFPDFIMRLDKYYRNPKIFHPMVKEGCGDSIQNLADGRSAMAFGNSSWMSILHHLHARDWDITEEPHETGTIQRTAGVLCSISSLTCHPEECLSLLNHLGSTGTQRTFALKGKPVARRDSCAELRLEGLGPASKAKFISMIESGRVLAKNSENSGEFLERVLLPESERWRSGRLTARQYLDSIQRKRDIFLNRTATSNDGR